MENCAKIWSKGVWFKDYADEIFQVQLSEAKSRFQGSERDLKLSIDHLERKARMNASGEVRSKLACREYTGIGRLRRGSDGLQVIPADDWTRAFFETQSNSVSVGAEIFDDVKVVPTHSRGDNAIAARYSEYHSHLEERIVPAPPKLRQLAVESCFDDGLIDFDDQNLDERFLLYLKWIARNHPTCDTTQRGLQKKSFEAEETEFKKNRGLSRS